MYIWMLCRRCEIVQKEELLRNRQIHEEQGEKKTTKRLLFGQKCVFTGFGGSVMT